MKKRVAKKIITSRGGRNYTMEQYQRASLRIFHGMFYVYPKYQSMGASRGKIRVRWLPKQEGV